MSIEQIESAFSQTLDRVLEVVGHSAAAHQMLLGDKTFDIAIRKIDDYLKLLKTLREELGRTAPESPHMAQRRSESVDEQNVSRRSESSERSPEDVRLDRSLVELIGLQNASNSEETTFLDATYRMSESLNQGGFLADESDMNGFNEISPESCGRRSRQSIDVDDAEDTLCQIFGSDPPASSNATIVIWEDDGPRLPSSRVPRESNSSDSSPDRSSVYSRNVTRRINLQNLD